MTVLISLLTFLLCHCTHQSNQQQDTLDSQKNDTVKTRFISGIDSTVVKEKLFKDLSNTYNFKLIFTESYRNTEAIEHHWVVEVYDKQMVKRDSIHQPIFVFRDLDSIQGTRSYSTGKNLDQQVVDNYYGDFVVADFNFDDKEDFAIINDIGGNGGTFYSYYLQKSGHKFAKNLFLSDSMTYFPTKFNKKQKTLTIYVHAGVCWLGEHIYEYDKSNWKQSAHRLIDVCKK